MTEAALALSEQKVQDLGELLAAADQERQSLSQRHEKERRLEQQVGSWAVCVGWWMEVYGGGLTLALLSQEAADRESKLRRDLSAANEKNLLLRSQV